MGQGIEDLLRVCGSTDSGGTYNLTQCLQAEFWWMHLPAGAAAETGRTCKSVPQGMGQITCFL